MELICIEKFPSGLNHYLNRNSTEIFPIFQNDKKRKDKFHFSIIQFSELKKSKINFP